MRELGILALAALLEAGGDAFVRTGLRSGRLMGFVLGAIVLFAYGVVVNTPRWDFGRLLGLYIVFFFVFAQVLAVVAFHEQIPMSRLVGGALVVAGGLVMTLWKT